MGPGALVVNLHRHTMPTMINVPYGDLIGKAEPLAKKRKTLDSGLNLGGKGAGGWGVEVHPTYDTVDHPYTTLNGNWAKAEKATPCLKFTWKTEQQALHDEGSAHVGQGSPLPD